MNLFWKIILSIVAIVTVLFLTFFVLLIFVMPSGGSWTNIGPWSLVFIIAVVVGGLGFLIQIIKNIWKTKSYKE